MLSEARLSSRGNIILFCLQLCHGHLGAREKGEDGHKSHGDLIIDPHSGLFGIEGKSGKLQYVLKVVLLLFGWQLGFWLSWDS